MRHVSVQQLSAFLDGALAGVSRELVTRHLAACASCRERHAGWREADDALRRVLSREPDERTLEEWSSRVELTIIADRKGLPAPEYSEFQHPVIAPSPVPDATRMEDVVRSTRPRAVASDPPEAAASEAEPLVDEREPASVILPFVAHPAASVSARTHDPGPRAASPPPPPAPRAWPEPDAEPARSPLEFAATAARPPRRAVTVLLSCAGALLLALLASPFLPEVIRIPLPERWRPRLPRVEFVRYGDTQAPADSLPPRVAPTSVASRPRALAERVPVPPVAVLVESVEVAVLPLDPATPIATPESDSLAAARVAAAPAPRPAPPVVRVTPRVRPRPELEESPEPSGRENTATVVPVRVSTTVELTPAERREPPPPTPAPAAPDTEENWPLLCGEVLDVAGNPLEGARVTLASPALTVRTDRRGRFCLACPAGARSLRVEADGLMPATRSVELTAGMVETRFVLAPAQ